jgi:hypothetical protein
MGASAAPWVALEVAAFHVRKTRRNCLEDERCERGGGPVGRTRRSVYLGRFARG